MAAFTTIDDPEAYFQVVKYTGNGSANHAITFDDTDTDMQPDLVWIKNRDAADAHCLFDAVRGATEVLHSDTTAVETDDDDTLDSFTSDGFQVDADDKVNTDTEKYVAWCWKAGTTSGIAGSPSITPTAYSFNATSGFSIIKYTANSTSGATLPHGLGVAPKMIIVKNLTTTESWQVYHAGNTAAPETDYLLLDTNAATADNAGRWYDTAPTSTLFSLGDAASTNENPYNYIAYCFTEKQGFSKFGTYLGNYSTNGPFVYTGFRPAFIIMKSYDNTQTWALFDNKRLGYNVDNEHVYPDVNSVEQTSDTIDILSNGFKMREDRNVTNGNGYNYIYMAFAEAPFVNSNGVPNNAR